MNIKTVSSAYFIPLPETTKDGQVFTRWINLANVYAVVTDENTETAKVVFNDKSIFLFSGEAYNILVRDLGNLYSTNNSTTI
jgi:hypothetical protein